MPHNKAKTRLRDLTIKEVSLVGKGDNPPARVVLFKAKGDGNTLSKRRTPAEVAKDFYTAALFQLTETLGRSPSREIKKQLFEEVRERDRAGDVFGALMRRKAALAESLHGILFFPDDGQDTGALIKETVRQFAAAIDDETAGLLSGEIAKAAEASAQAPPSVDELAAMIGAQVEKIQSTAGETRTEGAPAMAKTEAEILAGLTDEDRAVLTAKLDAQAAEITKLQPKAEETDPLEGVPEPVRKMIEKERSDREKEVVELRKAHADLQAASQRAEFAKTLDVDGLAAPQDELVGLLFDLPLEKRGALVKVLAAASNAAQLGIQTPAGSDLSNDSSSAVGKLEAAAAEIKKGDPSLTIEQARGEAYSQHPEWYVEADRERMRQAAASRLQ